MICPKELYQELERISYEILDEIVSPICDIPANSIWADIYLADIGCYTMGNEKEETQIIESIKTKYKVDEYIDIDAYESLIFIALKVYLRGEHTYETL